MMTPDYRTLLALPACDECGQSSLVLHDPNPFGSGLVFRSCHTPQCSHTVVTK